MFLDELLGFAMHLPSSYPQEVREHEAMQEATALEYEMRKGDADRLWMKSEHKSPARMGFIGSSVRLTLREKSYGVRDRPYACEER